MTNGKRIPLMSVAAASFIASAAPAALINDAEATTAVVVVNGQPFDVSDALIADAGTATLNADLFLPTGNVSVEITVGNSELITFGATTTNLSNSPVTYSFLFGTPVTPRSYTSATSSGGVVLTNGGVGAASITTSAIYPTFISAYGGLGAATTNLGVDLGTGTIATAATLGAPAVAQSFGQAANTFALTPYDALEVLLTYAQTGQNSVASFSGSATLSVPEPTTLTAGVGLLLLIRRRRRTDASPRR